MQRFCVTNYFVCRSYEYGWCHSRLHWCLCCWVFAWKVEELECCVQHDICSLLYWVPYIHALWDWTESCLKALIFLQRPSRAVMLDFTVVVLMLSWKQIYFFGLTDTKEKYIGCNRIGFHLDKTCFTKHMKHKPV